MILTKKEQTWLKVNSQTIITILNNYREDLKEKMVSEVDEERAMKYKFWANTCSEGIMTIKKLFDNKEEKPFTGV